MDQLETAGYSVDAALDVIGTLLRIGAPLRTVRAEFTLVMEDPSRHNVGRLKKAIGWAKASIEGDDVASALKDVETFIEGMKWPSG